MRWLPGQCLSFWSSRGSLHEFSVYKRHRLSMLPWLGSHKCDSNNECWGGKRKGRKKDCLNIILSNSFGKTYRVKNNLFDYFSLKTKLLWSGFRLFLWKLVCFHLLWRHQAHIRKRKVTVGCLPSGGLVWRCHRVNTRSRHAGRGQASFPPPRSGSCHSLPFGERTIHQHLRPCRSLTSQIPRGLPLWVLTPTGRNGGLPGLKPEAGKHCEAPLGVCSAILASTVFPVLCTRKGNEKQMTNVKGIRSADHNPDVYMSMVMEANWNIRVFWDTME